MTILGPTEPQNGALYYCSRGTPEILGVSEEDTKFLQDWILRARRVEITLPIRINVVVLWGPGGGLVQLTAKVPSRDDLSEESLQYSSQRFDLASAKKLLPEAFLRRVARGMLLHELDEGIKLEGEICFDPHLRDPETGFTYEPVQEDF